MKTPITKANGSQSGNVIAHIGQLITLIIFRIDIIKNIIRFRLYGFFSIFMSIWEFIIIYGFTTTLNY